MGWLSRHSERIFAAFRFVAGILFACHGAEKLFGAFGSPAMTSNPMMLAAGIIEFAGGILIAVGFLTPWVAFICSGQMAVAYFMAHAKGGFWPIENKGELAVLFCFAFLYIAARGAGPYSVDGMMRRKPGRAVSP
jgi:putative oxidoreductase